jgi:hypothetical protein
MYLVHKYVVIKHLKRQRTSKICNIGILARFFLDMLKWQLSIQEWRGEMAYNLCKLIMKEGYRMKNNHGLHHQDGQ